MSSITQRQRSVRKTRMNMSRAAVIVCAAWLTAGCANLDRSRNLGDPAVTGTVLAQQVCAMCHGQGGVATSPNFPNLAAQSPDYVVAQLTGFRNHSREDPEGFEYMWGISRRLTDVQIAQLAAYYAKQTPARQDAEADLARVKDGQTLFAAGSPQRGVPPCASCHGDHGQGLAAFPRIAGQHADYVRKQLRVFQNTNDRPAGAAMKAVAHGLDGDDIANVAAYLQTLSEK
jgi:cytochrome c553